MLVQMVHDFIESESATPLCSSTSESLNPEQLQSKYFTLLEVLRSRTDAESGVLEKVVRHMRNKRDADRSNSLKKWFVRRLKMDGFNASLCQTSWPTTLGCSAGDYEYIDVVMKGDKSSGGGGSVRIIVDIDFKSQFGVARPTSAYTQLSEALPSIYVGNEDKLDRIISILSSAAKQSLRERGLHIPPWRTDAYMRAKWLSDCHKVPAPHHAIAFSRENGEAKSSAHGSSKPSKWAPPMVKPKTRDLGGESALSSQFSNLGINCC